MTVAHGGNAKAFWMVAVQAWHERGGDLDELLHLIGDHDAHFNHEAVAVIHAYVDYIARLQGVR